MGIELHEKFVQIQSGIKVTKSLWNEFGKFHYRNAELILEQVKPIAAKYNCSIVVNDKVVNVGDRYYIESTAVLSDGKESIQATAYAREDESKKGMDGSQITGSASSYARKYALGGLFGIDDGRDSDTTNVKKTEKKEPKPMSDPQKNMLMSVWGKLTGSEDIDEMKKALEPKVGKEYEEWNNWDGTKLISGLQKELEKKDITLVAPEITEAELDQAVADLKTGSLPY